jgi:gliding motility-associated-like protein
MAGPTNTTIYTIVGYDANNCHSSINETVIIGALSPAPVVVSPVQYCINAVSVPLTAIGTNLIWYTVPYAGTGTTVVPVPSTAVPGTFMYYVSQTSSGCESPRDSIEVQVFDSVRMSFDIDVHVGCLNDSVLFRNTSTGGTQYLWTFNDGKTDTTTSTYHLFHPVLDSAVYWVQLNGANYVCSPDSIIKTFTLYPAPPIRFLHDLTHDQTIPYGKSIQLSVYGAWIYYWTPDNGSLDNNNISNPVAWPTEKTTFTVYGYDHTGCEDSGQVTIDVITTQEAIPSAFTPNGDGKNDIFHVINLAYGKLVEMHIYNRWGELVCSTTDNEKGWDGTLEGVPQDLGVYNYYIIVERENHERVFYKGDVTLIR